MPHIPVIVITNIVVPSEDRRPIAMSPVLESATELLSFYDRYKPSPDDLVSVPCKCVIHNRRLEAKASAEKQFGSLATLRASFSESYMNGPDIIGDEETLSTEDRWAQYILPFTLHMSEVMRASQAGPDAGCRMCKSTGTVKHHRKFIEGKFKSFSIGSDVLANLRSLHDPTFSEFSNLAGCACRVVDIDWPSASPFALIDPEGKWCGQGTIDEFGCVHDFREDWRAWWESTAQKYPQNIAILATCYV